jgi:hypothetical protein
MFSTHSRLRGSRLLPLVGVVALVNLLLLPVMAQTDDPVVSVSASDPVATEEGPTSGSFMFVRTGETDTVLEVSYTVGGTATAGADYVALSGVVSFGLGESSVSVQVVPIDDDLVEGNETVTVTLVAGDGYTLGALTSATVTIIDNDEAPLPVVSVSASDPVATEEGPTSGSFMFVRTGETDAVLEVSYTVGGTATAGADYVALSGVVSFGLGESSVSVQVVPIDDDLVEGNETVTVTLVAGDGYTLGALTSTTVTIIDNDEEDAEQPPFASISKDDCKNGGWKDFGVFKNQGDCVSFVATNGKNPPAFWDGDFDTAPAGHAVAAAVRGGKPGASGS